MKVERTGDSFAPGHTVGDHIYLLGIKNNQRPMLNPEQLALTTETVNEFVIEKMLISRDETRRFGEKVNTMKFRELMGQLNKHWLRCQVTRPSNSGFKTFSNFVFRPVEFIEKNILAAPPGDAVTEIFMDNKFKEAGIYPAYIELGIGLNLLAYNADIKNRVDVVNDIIKAVEAKFPELEILTKCLIQDGPKFYEIRPRPPVLAEEEEDVQNDGEIE